MAPTIGLCEIGLMLMMQCNDVIPRMFGWCVTTGISRMITEIYYFVLKYLQVNLSTCHRYRYLLSFTGEIYYLHRTFIKNWVFSRALVIEWESAKCWLKNFILLFKAKYFSSAALFDLKSNPFFNFIRGAYSYLHKIFAHISQLKASTYKHKKKITMSVIMVFTLFTLLQKIIVKSMQASSLS